MNNYTKILAIFMAVPFFMASTILLADETIAAKDLANLHKGEWLTVDVDGTGAADETNHTISVADDGSVTGHTGCNSYTAMSVVDGVNLSFAQIKVTKEMCESMFTQKAEKEFLAALGKANTYNVNVNVMRIYDADMKEVLKLRRLGTFTIR